MDRSPSTTAHGTDLTRYAIEFYSEVVRIRKLVESHAAAAAADDAPPPDSPEAREAERLTDPEILIQRLRAILDSQAVEVARRSVDFLTAEYKEAQYLLAALADDIFLHEVGWAGRDVWTDNILEYRLFRTRFAGERIFTRINDLVRSGDGRRVPMAELYLMALELGFKGRFRATEDDTPIREYMRQLFIFIDGRPPHLEDPDRYLIPDAYAHTLTDQGARGLRRGFDWPWMVGALGGGALVLSLVIWMVATTDLNSVVTHTFNVAR